MSTARALGLHANEVVPETPALGKPEDHETPTTTVHFTRAKTISVSAVNVIIRRRAEVGLHQHEHGRDHGEHGGRNQPQKP